MCSFRLFTGHTADVYWIILSLILTAGCSYQDCMIPNHPDNGRHTLCYDSRKNESCVRKPGTMVPDPSFLYVKCDEGFLPEGDFSQSICTDGQWQPSLPACLYDYKNDPDKCIAPLYPNHGTYMPLATECALNFTTAEHPLLPGKSFLPSSCVLRYKCDIGYTISNNDVISICDKGKWNPEAVYCSGSNMIPSRIDITRDHNKLSGCILPQQSRHGMFCSILRPETCYLPGGRVPPNEVIKVQCNEGYSLADKQANTICVNNSWTSEFPECKKLCSPLESDSLDLKCVYSGSQTECNKPMLPNTKVTISCKPSYKEINGLVDFYTRPIICKHNGQWSNSLTDCKPDCGVARGEVKITPTISSGTVTTLSSYPWHVGIYYKKEINIECQCGGSLITNRIVLTAAHCVATHQKNPENVLVAMGKIYRSWTSNDLHAIKRNVSHITCSSDYQEKSYIYAFDWALLLLSKKVEFNSYVMPVCLDERNELQVHNNDIGYVVGWGKTAPTEKESEILLHNNFSIMDTQSCLKKGINVVGTFCSAPGGSVTGSVTQKGDSGGGVTTIVNNQHFIIGVVSTRHLSRRKNDMSVFTNISWHLEKISIATDKLEENIV